MPKPKTHRVESFNCRNAAQRYRREANNFSGELREAYLTIAAQYVALAVAIEEADALRVEGNMTREKPYEGPSVVVSMGSRK